MKTDILSIGSLLMLIYTLLTSLWILFNATTASRLLLLYEDATKKAAKISSTAAEQLQRTRTTQTAGVLASVSTTTSALLGLYFSLAGTPDNVARRNIFLMGVGNAGLCLWIRRYMARFWAGSARVPLPGSTEYNDAVRATEQVMRGLRIVAMGWASIMAVNWEWS